MIGAILLATIGYGAAAYAAFLGFGALILSGTKHGESYHPKVGAYLVAVAFGVAFLTRWAVGL